VVRQGTADTWVIKGEWMTPVGGTAPAGWPTFPPEYPQTYEDCHRNVMLSLALRQP
jgi:hypothetical protein